jgi:hypothetical protein
VASESIGSLDIRHRHAKNEALFALSKPLKGRRMDTFLSHDWGTSRWQKLTMLVLFNSRAAAVASCFTCCVCMVPAMMFPWLAWWFAIPGYVVFVGLLFFWQRIRALLCGPKLVFLDRLCISQHDDHSVVAEVLLSCLVLF